MRPVGVKSPVLSVREGKPPSSRRAAPRPRAGPRRRRASTPKSIHATPLITAGNTIELVASCSQEQVAPTRLLSVSALGTEHQNHMGEAWSEHPFSNAVVTVVNRPVAGRSHPLVGRLLALRAGHTCDVL
jgi:hypothetical protein